MDHIRSRNELLDIFICFLIYLKYYLDDKIDQLCNVNVKQIKATLIVNENL